MDGEGVVTDEERVRALAASLREPVIVLDSERRLVAASPAAVAALGDAVPGRRVGGDARRALLLFLGGPPPPSPYQGPRARVPAAPAPRARAPLARRRLPLATPR